MHNTSSKFYYTGYTPLFSAGLQLSTLWAVTDEPKPNTFRQFGVFTLQPFD